MGVPGPKQERRTASPNHSDHVLKPHKRVARCIGRAPLRASHESVILNPGELLRILTLFMRALCAHYRKVEGQLQVRNQLDPTEAHRRRGAHPRALALTHHLCAVPRDSGARTRGSATAPDGSPTFRSASGTPTFSSTQLLYVPSISDCSTRGAKGRPPGAKAPAV